jgi:peptidoglycan LD-endopeptidase LytH
LWCGMPHNLFHYELLYNKFTMKSLLKIGLFAVLLFLIVGIYIYFRYPGLSSDHQRGLRVGDWIRDPQSHPDWSISAGQRCADAPFIFPTEGYIGFLWGDSFRPGHQHQGIDIFAPGAAGKTPVTAAYDGYLTRLPDWKSTVIIRIPQDPLQPDRQIWTYYTHMADQEGNSFIAEEFPPGTEEVFVEAGTLLGYQGNYSGDSASPVGVHLHFSIVQDDGSGHFLNELQIKNTLDPSPYFQMILNAAENQGEIPLCKPLATGGP